MNRYDYLLNLFTSEDLRNPLGKKHKLDGFVYACNRYMAVKIPEGKLAGEYEQIANYPDIQAVFKLDGADTEEIDTDALFGKLAAFRFEYEKKECGECNGEGNTECPHCESQTACRECDGTGEQGILPFARLESSERGQYLVFGGTRYDVTFVNAVALGLAVIGAKKAKAYIAPKDSPKILIHADEISFLIMGIKR